MSRPLGYAGAPMESDAYRSSNVSKTSAVGSAGLGSALYQPPLIHQSHATTATKQRLSQLWKEDDEAFTSLSRTLLQKQEAYKYPPNYIIYNFMDEHDRIDFADAYRYRIGREDVTTYAEAGERPIIPLLRELREVFGPTLSSVPAAAGGSSASSARNNEQQVQQMEQQQAMAATPQQSNQQYSASGQQIPIRERGYEGSFAHKGQAYMAAGGGQSDNSNFRYQQQQGEDVPAREMRDDESIDSRSFNTSGTASRTSRVSHAAFQPYERSTGASVASRGPYHQHNVGDDIDNRSVNASGAASRASRSAFQPDSRHAGGGSVYYDHDSVVSRSQQQSQKQQGSRRRQYEAPNDYLRRQKHYHRGPDPSRNDMAERVQKATQRRPDIAKSLVSGQHLPRTTQYSTNTTSSTRRQHPKTSWTAVEVLPNGTNSWDNVPSSPTKGGYRKETEMVPSSTFKPVGGVAGRDNDIHSTTAVSIQESKAIQTQSQARQRLMEEIEKSNELLKRATHYKDRLLYQSHLETLKKELQELTIADSKSPPRSTATSNKHKASLDDCASITSAGKEALGSYVSVVAPDNLPENYKFEAKVGKDKFMATVPRGGVTKGQVFTSKMGGAKDNDDVATIVDDDDDIATIATYERPLRKAYEGMDIPRGRWRDNLLDGLFEGPLHPLFWHSWFCPQIALSQIMARLRIVGPHKAKGFLLKSKLDLTTTVMLTALFYAVNIMLLYVLVGRGYALGKPPSTALLLSCGIPMLLIDVGVIAFFYFLLIKTRKIIRQNYDIPESTQCPGKEDALVSIFCTSCTVSQMGRHTADFSTYRPHCCTETGLPDHVQCDV